MAIKLSVGNEKANLHVDGDNANLKAGGAITAIKNYNLLTNKPQINGVELLGNKSFEDLGLKIDETPTEDSENAVSSGGVYDALENKLTIFHLHPTFTFSSQTHIEFTLPQNEHQAVVSAYNNQEKFAISLNVFGLYNVIAFVSRSDLLNNMIVFSAPCRDDFSGNTYFMWVKISIQNTLGEINLTIIDLSVLDDIPTKTSDLTNDGENGTSTYVEADELASVATSGSYSDLTDKPTIPAAQVNSDWNANSGVAQILNKPSIPSKTSDLNNDSGFVNATQAANAAPVQSVNGKTGAVSLDADDVGALPDTTPIPTKTSDLQNDGADGTSTYVEADDLATVATTGSYDDLQDKPSIPAAQVNADWSANSGVAEILNKPTIPAAGIPSGGNAGQVLKKNSATDYDVHWADQTQYYPSGYSTTGADKQTKQIACSSWTATSKSYLHILLTHANTYAGKIYFTVNAVNTYEVWINGAVSSATNYSLPAGTYIIYFDGSAFQVRTDGIIPASVNGTAARIPYGECDSTSTSTAYTATVPGITELKDGVTMLLYNGVVTSASGFTININGLGAKPSYSNMAMGNPITPTSPTRDTTIFNINYAFLFVYSETLVSGGCWIGYRGYDANTNTIGYQLRTNNTTMKASDKFYRYRLLFTSADGTKWVPANTSTSTNATAVRTPNTRAIDPFGEIVWYGTTTAIEANANVTAAQLWQEYYGSYTNIGYSFNNTGAAQTMTANLPIYIKCTPQADGSAIIDPTTPYTQSLPTTDDGKIYIYLGRAYNATNFEITMNHPVYYHDGTGIRLWTGVRQMPVAPSGDGTYILKCTVSNGAVTYNWIGE